MSGPDLAQKPSAATGAQQGLRKNEETQHASSYSLDSYETGKQWHDKRSAFRPTAGLSSWTKRVEARKVHEAVRHKEKEMKDEKEAERQRRIQAIRDKRAAKEEKERYEKMAEKMNKKRVERLKRKEKRNKLLAS